MIADIFKVLLIDNATGETFARTTLESASIEIKEESNEVEGGGSVYAIIHNGKKETIALSDVEVDFGIIAKQLGVDAVTGATIAYAMPKFYTVETGLIITLDNEPLVGSMSIFTEAGVPILAVGITSTVGKVVTLATGVVGDQIEVRTYKYLTGVTTQSIEINNTKFAKGVTAVLETIEITPEEVPINIIQFIFDSCAFDGGFKIDTKIIRWLHKLS